MKKIPGNLLKKTWKNHGNIMEFCRSEKVGTLYMCIVSVALTPPNSRLKKLTRIKVGAK